MGPVPPVRSDTFNLLMASVVFLGNPLICINKSSILISRVKLNFILITLKKVLNSSLTYLRLRWF